MKLRQILTTAAIVVATTLSSGCPDIKKVPYYQCPQLYDREANWFHHNQGGINEPFLNSLGLDVNDEYLKYLEKIDTIDRSLEVHPLTYEASFDKGFSYLDVCNNIDLIKRIDQTPAEKVKPEHSKLKEVLEELHYNVDGETSTNQKIKIIYDTLINRITNRVLKVGSVGIEELLNGAGGDCSNLAPAYFAVLQHFGVKSYLRSGRLWNFKHSFLHMWLSVESDNGLIDLDPMNYHRFVPLDNKSEVVPYVDEEQIREESERAFLFPMLKRFMAN